jgi:NitT/TauT family transport system permease protein
MTTSSPDAPGASSTQGLKPTLFWGIAEDIPRSLSSILLVFSIVIPFSAWWIVASLPGMNAAFLPSPPDVVRALGGLWDRGFLLQDTWASVFRVSCGFLLAAVISVPLGILMGTFASIASLLEPIIGILRYMPAPAFTPLLIIYLGLDEPPKIALIFLGTIFYNVLMIMDAVKYVPKDLLEATYTLGGRRFQVLTQVILPYATPSIIDTFRINIATSWNMVIVAELVAAEVGLGKRIQLAQRFFRTDEIFACLIVLGLIGFLLDLAFRALLRWSCRWAVD